MQKELTMQPQKQSGFSLLELLVVISIIAVLAAAAVGGFRVANQKSRNARREADIEQLRSALEIYRADEGVYPNLKCNSTEMGADGNDDCWTDLLNTLNITGDLSDPYYKGQDKTNPTYAYDYVGGGAIHATIGSTSAKTYIVRYRTEPDAKIETLNSPMN